MTTDVVTAPPAEDSQDKITRKRPTQTKKSPPTGTAKRTGKRTGNGKDSKGANNLATAYPEIAAQWHPVRNGSLTPYDVTPKAGRTVWWKCEKAEEHEWQARIDNRTRRSQPCPYCGRAGRYRRALPSSISNSVPYQAYSGVKRDMAANGQQPQPPPPQVMNQQWQAQQAYQQMPQYQAQMQAQAAMGMPPQGQAPNGRGNTMETLTGALGLVELCAPGTAGAQQQQQQQLGHGYPQQQAYMQPPHQQQQQAQQQHLPSYDQLQQQTFAAGFQQQQQPQQQQPQQQQQQQQVPYFQGFQQEPPQFQAVSQRPQRDMRHSATAPHIMQGDGGVRMNQAEAWYNDNTSYQSSRGDDASTHGSTGSKRQRSTTDWTMNDPSTFHDNGLEYSQSYSSHVPSMFSGTTLASGSSSHNLRTPDSLGAHFNPGPIRGMVPNLSDSSIATSNEGAPMYTADASPIPSPLVPQNHTQSPQPMQQQQQQQQPQQQQGQQPYLHPNVNMYNEMHFYGQHHQPQQGLGQPPAKRQMRHSQSDSAVLRKQSSIIMDQQ